MSNDKHDPELTRRDIREGEIDTHIERISREFKDGFEFLKKYPKSVSVFGSSVMPSDIPEYKMASEVTARIVRELGYAVITGGGPGIMEAANRGAYDAGGASLGMNISLPHERVTNAFVTHAIKFAYFFSRKTMLTFAAEAYIFFPGGYGTMDELFDILTLVQTGKIPRVPIILFGSSFWKKFTDFLEHAMFGSCDLIERKDMDLFEVTDSPDRVLAIVRAAPISEWWRNIN